MPFAVVGTGAVGLRAARHLAAHPDVEQVTVVSRRPARADEVAAALGPGVVAGALDRLEPATVAVLAHGGDHVADARRLLALGCGVVSTSGAMAQVEGLLALHAEATERRLPVVAGAAMAPGLTCLLVAHAATRLDEVHEVSVARSGSAGPSCEEERRSAVAGDGSQWHEGWEVAPRGGGRRVVWFPSPVGGRDCRFAALPEAMLAHRAAPSARRVSARIDARPGDRLRAALPARRGAGLGAVVVEVWGSRDGAEAIEVLGAVDRPGVVAGAVAAVGAVAALEADVVGAVAMGDLAASPLLAALAERGVSAARFTGT